MPTLAGVSGHSFQSTLSMRRATSSYPRAVMLSIFQSTLSMRRATGSAQRIYKDFRISIHALHEESHEESDPNT